VKLPNHSPMFTDFSNTQKQNSITHYNKYINRKFQRYKSSSAEFLEQYSSKAHKMLRLLTYFRKL